MTLTMTFMKKFFLNFVVTGYTILFCLFVSLSVCMSSDLTFAITLKVRDRDFVFGMPTQITEVLSNKTKVTLILTLMLEIVFLKSLLPQGDSASQT